MTAKGRREFRKLAVSSAFPSTAGTRAIAKACPSHWCDPIVASEQDPSWSRRLTGHMETGRASPSDPAFG